MELMRIWWNIYICTILLAEVLSITMAACPSDTCAVINSSEMSLATQVINILNKERTNNNDSFTFYIQPKTYNTTNGTETDFYHFSNITFQKDPKFSDEVVIIQCPYYTDVDDFNGLGFINCNDISIIGLTFTRCGQKTFSSYFENVNNLNIVNSTFHHNLDSGLGIRSGTNINIANCTFESSVALQNDSIELLIEQMTTPYGGSGLGISLLNTTNTTVNVEGCTFRDNVALKSISGEEIDNDTRPYNYIPYGNGGAIHINLNNVTDVTIRIVNCHFYNNTALHQGGAIAVFVVASRGNIVEIIDCDFIDNKAIGHPLINQIKRPIVDYDNFIAEINSNFTVENFNVSIEDALSHVSSETIFERGGFGGALMVNIFRDCEYNQIFIKRSTFKRNLAIGFAAVGIAMRGTLSSLSNGVNSNRAWINGYVYITTLYVHSILCMYV